jgi:hypothetical protein
MAVRVSLMDILDGWKGEMIIVIVRDDDRIDGRYIRDLARRLCITLGPQPRQRGASILEDRVEQHSKTARELNIVASVATKSAME